MGSWECVRAVTAQAGYRPPRLTHCTGCGGSHRSWSSLATFMLLKANGCRSNIFTCCQNPRRFPFSLRSGSGTAQKKKPLRSAVGMGHSNVTQQSTQASGSARDTGPETLGAESVCPFVLGVSPRHKAVDTQPSSRHLKEVLISLPLVQSEPCGKTMLRGKQKHTAFAHYLGNFMCQQLAVHNTGLLIGNN